MTLRLVPILSGLAQSKPVASDRHAIIARLGESVIVGSGIDVAEVKRIEQAIERHGRRFLERVFTPAEIAYCERRKNKFERYAARFAAKEAAQKALGTGWRGGIAWRDFEITNLASGKPTLKLTGGAGRLARRLKVKQVTLSLSHTRDVAIAQVILES